MAGLLDPRNGDGTWVENRPSKGQMLWGIAEPYVMGPWNAWKGLMDADLDTLLYDTGPKGQQAVENAFNVAGTVTGGSSVVPKPDDALNMGIKAFHGSPHDFDRFSLDKIGTGEGAQAYGHGLYFAENEDIARSYRDNNMGRGTIMSGKADSLPARWQMAVFEAMKKPAGEIRDNAIELLRSKVPPEYADLVNSLLNNKGRMYEVEINADPEQFLDWDKPLSEQPEAVRNALKKLNIDTGSMTAKDRVETIEAAMQGDPRLSHLLGRGGVNVTGDTVYKGMSDSLGATDWPITADAATRAQFRAKGATNASQALREAGIPGIKYLDAGSRSAGDGSRNYVVFDDNLINIIRKYGIAGLLGGGAAMNAMTAEPREQY